MTTHGDLEEVWQPVLPEIAKDCAKELTLIMGYVDQHFPVPRTKLFESSSKTVIELLEKLTHAPCIPSVPLSYERAQYEADKLRVIMEQHITLLTNRCGAILNEAASAVLRPHVEAYLAAAWTAAHLRPLPPSV